MPLGGSGDFLGEFDASMGIGLRGLGEGNRQSEGIEEESVLLGIGGGKLALLWGFGDSGIRFICSDWGVELFGVFCGGRGNSVHLRGCGVGRIRCFYCDMVW